MFATTNGLFYKGSSEYGELGHGSEYTYGVIESRFSETLRKRGEKIVQIQCGDHNTVLLTDQGKAYITGYCLHGVMPCLDEAQSEKDEDHLYSFTQIDISEPITQICCAYYHMCFVCKSGDLWTSKGLLDLMYTLDSPYGSQSISGAAVSLHHFENKKVCESFGSQIASIKGGDYSSLVITTAGDVFMPRKQDGVESTEKMKKLDAEIVRSIFCQRTTLAASLGETFSAIFSLPYTDRSYAKKLYSQLHSKNPFVDVTINKLEMLFLQSFSKLAQCQTFLSSTILTLPFQSYDTIDKKTNSNSYHLTQHTQDHALFILVADEVALRL
jgi:hypothetical protein